KKDMGGLRKHMPLTFAGWMLSTAALCGVPFFSGFWSKGEIIDNAGNNDYTVCWIIGIGGAATTASYNTSASYRTCFGKARSAAAGEHHDEHDAPTEVHADDHALVGVGAGAGALAGAHGASDPHDAHDDHGHGPTEAPRAITGPIMILAFLALFSGF